MTNAPAKLEAATSNDLGGYAFARKYDLRLNSTLHHVTYAPAKFEVATTNGLGVYTITRNLTDGHTQKDRWTNFGMKLIYPFF